MPNFMVNINTTRNAYRELPDDQRIAAARSTVKLLITMRGAEPPIDSTIVPDFLASDAVVARYFEIEPPIAAVMPEFQEIIDEIEYTYVAGLHFAAVSASCVTIERLLNLARIELHPFQVKIKELWGKGPSNSWYENIDALRSWGYIDATFATELRELYDDVRNRYLHCGDIRNLAADSLRAVRAAYRLLQILLGFPGDLFQIAEGRMRCANENDPRYKAFYAKHVVD